MSNLGLYLSSFDVNKDTRRVDYMERAGFKHYKIGKHIYLSWEGQCHYNETFVDFVKKYISVFLLILLFPIELIFRLIQQIFRIIPSVDIITEDTNNKTAKEWRNLDTETEEME